MSSRRNFQINTKVPPHKAAAQYNAPSEFSLGVIVHSGNMCYFVNANNTGGNIVKKKLALFMALLAICLSMANVSARADHTYRHYAAPYSESSPPREIPIED